MDHLSFLIIHSFSKTHRHQRLQATLHPLPLICDKPLHSQPFSRKSQKNVASHLPKKRSLLQAIRSFDLHAHLRAAITIRIFCLFSPKEKTKKEKLFVSRC
jgi:hypothetical protein